MTETDSHSAFETLLAHSDDALVIVDERLRIVRAGPGAAALADRDAGELTGMSVIAAFGSA
ncbi:MAG: PAS domain-containing protein, partial [Chloroflexota bacterium]|nr:PAS domain-containing protein [Chloroflexota bacterium]